MGFGAELFKTTVNTATSGGVGLGLGLLNKALQPNAANEQLRQQQKLNQMQYDSNLGLMKESYKAQKEMWDATNSEAQVAHLKAAGLNPALMYGGGGGGGTTTGSGSASIGGAQASDESSRQMANTASLGMGLQLAKLQSEIKVNESVAKVNEANAVKATEEGTTVKESRSYLVEKLKQDGKGQWLSNLQEQFKMNDAGEVTVVKNKLYGEGGVNPTSLFSKEITTNIANAEAQAKNSGAQALLNNNKALGYFQELLNDTARADAAGVQAAAAKLSSEFNSGELQNAKYWVQMGSTILKSLLGIVK